MRLPRAVIFCVGVGLLVRRRWWVVGSPKECRVCNLPAYCCWLYPHRQTPGPLLCTAHFLRRHVKLGGATNGRSRRVYFLKKGRLRPRGRCRRLLWRAVCVPAAKKRGRGGGEQTTKKEMTKNMLFVVHGPARVISPPSARPKPYGRCHRCALFKPGARLDKKSTPRGGQWSRLKRKAFILFLAIETSLQRGPRVVRSCRQALMDPRQGLSPFFLSTDARGKTNSVGARAGTQKGRSQRVSFFARLLSLFCASFFFEFLAPDWSRHGRETPVNLAPDRRPRAVSAPCVAVCLPVLRSFARLGSWGCCCYFGEKMNKCADIFLLWLNQ
ncbi:hypothetical protein TW95_gp1140 [Pandoravirus inopinatum]|uniref:Uncharacterized protein n=1 Tax=Pandoravirus inopinatum TaxID=1605721 RepID=A0A0B5J2S5_9VIRU|nr:hypothetical protein TW95_gp1140 [Pandoravirus inopinatum]AJF97874.1 hypothetical protein [Pandoravirus inopinatum]